MFCRTRIAAAFTLALGAPLALAGCDDAVSGRADDMRLGAVRDAAPDGEPPDVMTGPEPDAGSEPDSEPEPEADAAPDAEPEPEPEPEPDAAPDPDAAPEPEPDLGPPPAVCGDGVREAPEACDDGDTDDGDYCAGDCSAITGACGDGALQDDEACDDGDTEDGDYCAADCSAITGACGDGVVQGNERCDDGVIAAGCDATHDGGDGACVPADACSDGFVLGADGGCTPAELETLVDIFVANDCTMRVEPPEVHVPRGQTVSFTYRNRSRDYPVDVWLSYGGGFLDLETGTEWDDRFTHCTGPRRPRQESAEISTACSNHVFVIYCD